MEKSRSFNYHSQDIDLQNLWNADLGLSTSDRRMAFSRQSSFHQSHQDSSHDFTKPFLSRTMSSIDIPPGISNNDKYFGEGDKFNVFRAVRYGNRQMKRLVLMISLNVAYSTVEMAIGLFTGRVGLVSDAFHLTFGCGLLTFSIFAMAISRKKPDLVYTYGYKRLEALSAFTNATAVSFVHVILLGCRSTSRVYTR